jgi:helicase
MTFRGLFIGIDRNASSAIDELTCARRDVVALEALFSDTIGGQTVLLTDEDATRQRIEFADLATCHPEDTVVMPGCCGTDHRVARGQPWS